MNGDGVDDIVVGEPWWRSAGEATGRVFVFSGSDGALLHTFRARADHRGYGVAVSSAGDVDHDGSADVVVGSHSGHVEARSGRTGEVIHSFSGFQAVCGCSIDGNGDANADGIPDIVVGATTPWGGAGSIEGAVYVLSGADGSVLTMKSRDTRGDHWEGKVCRAMSSDLKNCVRFVSKDGGHFVPKRDALGFGKAVVFLGDVDGDKRDDFAVGAPNAFDGEEYVGSVTVFSGRTGDEIWTAFGWSPGSLFGWSLAALGDADGDSVPDVVVGTFDHAVVVLSGRTGSEVARDCSGLGGYWTGFADTVCGIGDVDDDGAPDFAIGQHERFPDVEDSYHVRRRGGADARKLGTLGEVVPESHRVRDPYSMKDYRDGWTVVGSIGDIDDDGVSDLVVGLPVRGLARVVSARELKDLLLLAPPGLEPEWGPKARAK